MPGVPLRQKPDDRCVGLLQAAGIRPAAVAGAGDFSDRFGQPLDTGVQLLLCTFACFAGKLRTAQARPF